MKKVEQAIKDDPELGRRLAFLSVGYPEMAEQTTAESRRIRQAECLEELGRTTVLHSCTPVYDNDVGGYPSWFVMDIG